MSNKKLAIKDAAEFRSNNIIDYCGKLLGLNWPAILDELLPKERSSLPSTRVLLSTLLNLQNMLSLIVFDD